MSLRRRTLLTLALSGTFAGAVAAAFAGPRSGYAVAPAGVSGAWTVVDPGGGEGSDTLSGIEFLAFADATVAVSDLAAALSAGLGAAGGARPRL